MVARKVRFVLGLLFTIGIFSTGADEAYYKRPAVFAYRPSATASKQVVGRFGPVGMQIELHQPAFTMKVGKLEPGSPAEKAGLKPGQFIESINGEKLADIDPRIQIGNMVTKAEAKDGLLRMMIKDTADAAPLAVDVKIPALGTYSHTWPLNCKKSDAIVNRFADEVANRPWGGSIGLNGNEILFLLSTGREQDLAVVRERMNKTIEYYEKGAAHSYSWYLGYGGIPLTEYYLRTGDKRILPVIQKFVDSAVKHVYNDGWGGRGFGGYTYGQMNAAGTQVTTFLLLARKCGVKGHERVMEKALRQQFRFAGRGATPYGDHLPNLKFIDNGKTAVLAFTMAAAASLTPDGEQSIYARARDICASRSFYSTSFMNVGHTGGGIGEVWRGASVGLLADIRPKQYRELLENRRYFMELSRQFNSAFCIAFGGGYEKKTDWGTTMGLSYTVPRKTLQITGAPNSPYGQSYKLPERIWGTAADDAFQSLKPIAGPGGTKIDLQGEAFLTDAAAPSMSRMGVPSNGYHHKMAPPTVPPTSTTYDHYAHHPEAGLRCYAAERISATQDSALIVRFLNAKDARLRAVGCQAIKGKSNRLPTEKLTSEMTDALVRMISDSEESWWVTHVALSALTLAPREVLIPHVDRLLILAQHEEWWIQSSALEVIAVIADEPALAKKIYPELGTVIASNKRFGAMHPIANICAKLSGASSSVRASALSSFAEAYTTLPQQGKNRQDAPHPSAVPELLKKLATGMASIPGGLDELYAVSSKRFPEQSLPHKEIFLSKSDFSGDPKAQQALVPSLMSELIPEYVGKNRTKFLSPPKITRQNGYPGGSQDTIDGLVSLYEKAGIRDYSWHVVADFREANWHYLSFDPIASEQVPWDQLITRYRDVTAPQGSERWSAADFDAAAAGWKVGKSPFGNYLGKLPKGPLPKCGTRCIGKMNGCYGAHPCNTLWDKEVLLLSGTFKVPAFKDGYRYRLRINEGDHVGRGGGYQIFVNGKELIEQKSGGGRGSNDRARGAFITKAFWQDFQGQEVTIAVKTFIRYNCRYKAKPSGKHPQSRVSLHIEGMKKPIIDEKLMRQSVAATPMTSSTWQDELTAEDRESRNEGNKYRFNGVFEPNPKILGRWQSLTQVESIAEFDPDSKHKKGRGPFNQVTLLEDGYTAGPLWAWSGNMLFDLAKNQALRMELKTIDGNDYLFVEDGGFSHRQKPGWKTTWTVCRR